MENQLLVVAEFESESDLLYFVQELKNLGISSKYKEPTVKKSFFVVKVNQKDYKQSRRLLRQLNYKEINKAEYTDPDNDSDYLEELSEWNSGQYDPGHYTGGKTPHFYSKPGRPKLLGGLFLFTGIPGIFLGFFSLIDSKDVIDFFENGVFFVASIIFVIVGLKIWNKKQNKFKE